MINWTRATQPPRFGWQNEPLQLIAMRPPAVPKPPHIFARRFFIHVEVRCFQETSYAEEQRLAVTGIFTQQPQRQALCQKRERQLIFLVPERAGDLLKSVSSRPCASILLRIRLAFCRKRNCAAEFSTLHTRSSSRSFS